MICEGELCKRLVTERNFLAYVASVDVYYVSAIHLIEIPPFFA